MSVDTKSVQGKRTVVLGASPNSNRFAHSAVLRLQQHGHIPIAIGKQPGSIGKIPIMLDHPQVEDVDTVSIYLNRENQKGLYQYILSLKPKRIIFNPGAENPEFSQLAQEKGIEVLNACTLVLLVIGEY